MIEQEIQNENNNNNTRLLDNTPTNNENITTTTTTRQKTVASNDPCRQQYRYTYIATGVVANARLSPLLPASWEDISTSTCSGGRRAALLESKTVNSNAAGESNLNSTSNVTSNSEESNVNSNSNSNNSQSNPKKMIPDFLWENAPRHKTKPIRDHVKVYSHLPNGITILDSKWVLGKLFSKANTNTTNNDNGSDNNNENPYLATCETHCFTGVDGFTNFARSVKLFKDQNTNPSEKKQLDDKQKIQNFIASLPDIARGKKSLSCRPNNNFQQRPHNIPTSPLSNNLNLNWWVVKDAGANGAGGVWVVGPDNAQDFADNGPLLATHKYVAQQYVWPPVLYEGKKCHVRVYATVTYDGRAFVHERAFLHVANDLFTVYTNNGNDDNDDTQQQQQATSTNTNTKNQKIIFEDCVHITNCCANSHDDTKFAGEILAHFGHKEYTTCEKTQQPVVPLADFFPSVRATISEVVTRMFQNRLLDGGQSNNGFEYCGMDFMLSYDEKNAVALPKAYLLEINAPPSQDTASSLPHAEDLHNTVLRDWMTYWVIPRVDASIPVKVGGWIECKVKHNNNNRKDANHNNNSNNNRNANNDELAVASKAAMLNKIRWALLERKLQKKEASSSKKDAEMRIENNVKGTQQQQQRTTPSEENDACDCDNNYPSASAIQISRFARSQFPFFSTTTDNNCGHDRSDVKVNGMEHNNNNNNDEQIIFFENAGGAQVPQSVIDQMTLSLTKRHREKIGSDTKLAARETLQRLLVGGGNDSSSVVVILGLNATSLLQKLANHYSKLLTPADEVLVSTENHLANFDPWILAAKIAGAKIKLWTPYCAQQQSQTTCYDDDDDDLVSNCERSSDLNHLVTPHTRIVAIPHASNVLGLVRPIADLSKTIKDRSKGYAHVVVDGVAVAPHDFVGFDESFGGNVDWYVVSMHKLFGPHIGVLMGRKNPCLDEILGKTALHNNDNNNKSKEERIQAILESGTANIEGCAGVVGLGMYFKSLSQWWQGKSTTTTTTRENSEMISVQEARLAYRLIRTVETELLRTLLRRLALWSPQVRILDGSSSFIPNGNNRDDESVRLPTVSFVHESISSHDMYKHCQEHGIICRNGFFLCTRYLAKDLEFQDHPHGVFRVSLAHYNTPREVQALCDTLESMPNWFS